MSEKFKPSKPISSTDDADSPILKENINETEQFSDYTCTYNGQQYSAGSEICINKTVFKCGPSGWYRINRTC